MFLVQLILFQLFIFGAIAIGLKFLMGKNVTKTTAHLQELSAKYMVQEQELKKKYAELNEKYEATIKQAKEDAAEIREKGIREAREESTKIMGRARQESEQIVGRAEKSGEEIKKAMDKHIDERATAMTYELIESVLPEDVMRDMHSRWEKELIEGGFKDLKRMNIPHDVEEAAVITPYKLGPSESDAIKKELKKSLGRQISLKEDVDKHLLAGIVIKIGSVVLDGSLVHRFREAQGSRKA